MKKKFKIEIDCANCAAKVETAIRKIDGVQEATISFMTQKLTVEADESRFAAIMDEIERVGRKIEPDFSIER